MKKSIKIHRHIFELFWLLNGAWAVHISLLIQTKWLFFTEESSIMDRGLRSGFVSILAGLNFFFFLLMDLFLANKIFFASQDVNWCTGVVWITVMFLSALWTLILTAPIHCRGSTGEQVMKCYISPNLMKKHSSTPWMTRGLNFQQIVISEWTIRLKQVAK